MFVAGRRASLLAAALFVKSSLQAQPPTEIEYWAGGSICNENPWQLVFFDDFDQSALDPTKWIGYFPYTSDGSDQCCYCRLGDDAVSMVIQDDNVYVSDGICHIQALNETAPWWGETRSFTTGMLYSRTAFNEGKFEIRCKIPTGNRLWPAFWLNGGETEIDVFEQCGSDAGALDLTLHRWWNDHQGHAQGHAQVEQGWTIHDSFHTYAVEWDRFYVRFYFDDEEIWWRSRYQDPLSGEMTTSCALAPGPVVHLDYFPKYSDYVHVIVGLGILAPDHAGVCDTTLNSGGAVPLPADFEIDYVRVYQRDIQAGLVNLCSGQVGIQSYPTTVCPSTQTTYNYFGPHGDLSWTCSSNLTITSTTATSVTVQCSENSREWGWIEVFDDDPACSFPGPHHKDVWLGGARIESVNYEPIGCTDRVEVVVQTSPYNNEERFYWLDNSFQYTNCDGQHYTAWHLGEDFAFCPPTDDFCAALDIEVRGVCEDYPATFHTTVRDHCVIGPCDLLDPDISERLSHEVSVVPTPAETSFDM